MTVISILRAPFFALKAALPLFIFTVGFSQSVHAAVNVALPANGGVITASSSFSSNYPVIALNDGDRKGANWAAGGGWNDATSNAYPDWVQIDFSASQTLNEIDLFTIQDNYGSPSTPTLTMPFSQYGITDFQVQYWTGAAWTDVPSGNVTGNRNVWRQITFASITTTKIRVVINNSLGGYSRLAEIEAYAADAAPSGMNVALASNGGVVTVSSAFSSNFPATSLNNGDRRGTNWQVGGGWNDATSGAYPDWVQIDFGTNQTLNEIDLFTIQDSYGTPSTPTLGMQFSQWGVTDFQVQYWTGATWADVPGGNVTGNRNVWRQFTFANITTTKIKVAINNSLGGYSRLAEIEAYRAPTAPSGLNVALAANGGVATVSSAFSNNFSASSLNNGDRKGANWQFGGGWNDATSGVYPDWVQVDFGASQLINEIDLFTIQDNYGNPSTPTVGMQFSQWGVTDFQVQYWTGAGWADVAGGNVTSNRNVWRQFSFPSVTTTKIRVVISNSLGGYSRLAEIEAYQAPGVPVPTATGQQSWIAIRTDGLPGSGTQADPYDGSTPEKFDAIMSRLQWVPNAGIHLVGPGPFRTNLNHDWFVRSGWVVSGDGMYATTVQLTGSLAGMRDVVVFRSDPNYVADNITITNLTIDCNWPQLGASADTGVLGEKNCKVGAVLFCGSNNLIDHVRTINTYGSLQNYQEDFAIFLVSPSSIDGTNDVIQYCRAEMPQGTHEAPFGLAGWVWSEPKRTIRNSKVLGCTAVGVNNGLCIGKGFASGGVNFAHVKDCQIDGNTFIDCLGAAYIDTDSVDGLKVTNNTVIRGWKGVGLSNLGQPKQNIEISGNNFGIQNRVPNGASYGMVVGFGPTTNLTVTNNTITFETTGAGINSFWGIGNSGLTNATVTNNTIGFAYFVVDNCATGTGVTLFNNLQTDGTPVPGL